jgi:trans-aconitate 3-methyltransferase
MCPFSSIIFGFVLIFPFLTGQATSRLSAFDKIVGIDPSLPMIQAAREDNEKDGSRATERITFVQGDAEDLNGILADNSVDMLVSGLSSRKIS